MANERHKIFRVVGSLAIGLAGCGSSLANSPDQNVIVSQAGLVSPQLGGSPATIDMAQYAVPSSTPLAAPTEVSPTSPDLGPSAEPPLAPIVPTVDVLPLPSPSGFTCDGTNLPEPRNLGGGVSINSSVTEYKLGYTMTIAPFSKVATDAEGNLTIVYENRPGLLYGTVLDSGENLEQLMYRINELLHTPPKLGTDFESFMATHHPEVGHPDAYFASNPNHHLSQPYFDEYIAFLNEKIVALQQNDPVGASNLTALRDKAIDSYYIYKDFNYIAHDLGALMGTIHSEIAHTTYEITSTNNGTGDQSMDLVNTRALSAAQAASTLYLLNVIEWIMIDVDVCRAAYLSRSIVDNPGVNPWQSRQMRFPVRILTQDPRLNPAVDAWFNSFGVTSD